MQLGEVTVDLAYKIIKQAYPFRNLKLEDLSNILEILDSI